MKRRIFLQGLGALAAAPALPTLSAAAPPVPTAASAWARYFASLHNSCTPTMLQNVLRVSAAEAQSVATRLVAQGALHPAQIAAPRSIRPAHTLRRVTNRIQDHVLKADAPATENVDEPS